MSKEFNVVVVVDVQNCFMFATSDQNSNLLNLGFKGTAKESKQIATEIAELVRIKTEGKSNNAVVFTRDYHPLNHISFEHDEGRVIDHANTWPRHCRNPNVKCEPRNGAGEDIESGKSAPSTEKLTLDKVNKSNDVNLDVVEKNLEKLEIKPSEIPIQGTELSYYFYETPLATVVYKLNTRNKQGTYKIGLSQTLVEENETKNSSKSIVWTNIKIPTMNLTNQQGFKDTKFIALTKGERCDEESYSAFNYHVKYNTDGEKDYDIKDDKGTVVKTVKSSPQYPVAGPNKLSSENSTGLWEWILNNKGDANVINITVCGLVGNVCVVFTVLQGIAMWEAVYALSNPGITVNFEYSLMGTRFTTGLPPSKGPDGTTPTVKPFDDFSNDQWNKDNGFGEWIQAMKGYYAVNILSKDFLSEEKLNAIKGKSFKVLNYKGEFKETVNMGDVLSTAPPDEPITTSEDLKLEEPTKPEELEELEELEGGRRSRKLRHRKRHTHKIDKSGYCKLCYKYCKNKKLTKRNRKSKRCRK
jgi:nicotinamidase-related amidase